MCLAWERSRSARYARRTREQTRATGAAPGRRGPTPTVSDETLLAAIRADLARSSFQGEGHRKVQARLIRFRGHIPKGGYDVHDGQNNEAPASAPAVD